MGRTALPLFVLLLLPACTTVAPQRGTEDSIRRPVDFHADLDGFLQRHVDALGNVRYREAMDDRADLVRYVALLAHVSPDSHPGWFPTEADRIAYWINAYNASVLNLVFHYYPIESVHDLRPPRALFFLPRGAGFFVFRRVVLGGVKVNLYSLEHRVLRRRFDEPRIHFAINCASRSCPRLPQSAFRAEALEDQLQRETRRFLGELHNLRVDRSAGVMHLSSILDWYERDFTSWVASNRPESAPTLKSYVALHIFEDGAGTPTDCDECRIEFVEYDWALNDVELE